MLTHWHIRVCATFEGGAAKVEQVARAPLRHLRHPPLGVAGGGGAQGHRVGHRQRGPLVRWLAPLGTHPPPARASRPSADRHLAGSLLARLTTAVSRPAFGPLQTKLLNARVKKGAQK